MIYELVCVTCKRCIVDFGNIKSYSCKVFPDGIPQYENWDEFRKYPCEEKGERQYIKGDPTVIEEQSTNA